MQIVIDIPEGMLNELHTCRFPIQDAYRLCKAIEDGTPLPKGHGDLIDRNEIRYTRNNNPGEFHFWYVTRGTVDRMKPIVHADKEGAGIVEKSFDWNDNMSEVAIEDFQSISNKLTYGVASSIGTALAKLAILEKQRCRVEEVDE